jgi:hypothetical protein
MADVRLARRLEVVVCECRVGGLAVKRRCLGELVFEASPRLADHPVDVTLGSEADMYGR